MLKKIILLGCLIGTSFFIGCNSTSSDQSSDKPSKKKELIMYEDSELALLMRKMYADNLEIRNEIIKGNIPESFPEDFYTIHTAKATKPEKINETFNALAKEYLKRMNEITAAETKIAAKLAYNNMISSCASCHQIYCQGPLPKIRKMMIPLEK